ncbi:late embryogenesis abundant protein 3 [Brachypodium distachyon]|uniref:SMP domain-containing protein n=1 Tax=Brachypodium distachyon TaxID=15368 RepID=I1GNC0_BRADI|nr:late embryogenesis abundant protein 3 [Brachypodium distachyon]KQK13229.1 hypothetical protein BRADI_1g08740v3 [Brachypodium distachyon]|eukprot:XP_024312445.1 late embryogenesis abundant protein 3 [Brachypodium distachyon]
MAEARSRLDCRVYSEAEPSYQGREFAAEPVAPRDDAEFVAERLAHRGDDGVVDEGYDTKVKISEALEAAARAVGGDPVERSDAAAIRAAEARAVGAPIPGGVAEQAQAAADANAGAEREEDKVTIADVVAWNATAKLPTDKAVTEEDAAAVAEAEAAHGAPDGAAARGKPYGVGEALAAAARHNQEDVLVGKTITDCS